MRHKFRFFFRAGAVALLLPSLVTGKPAAAQDPQREDSQRAERVRQGAEVISQTAAQARQFQTLDEDDPGVSYAQVLKDPDNIELNMRFAQTQMREGQMRGAAATLERILLLEPNFAQARLLYAVVLFRLDNGVEAEREFKAIADYPMPDRLRAEIDTYLDELRLRKKRTRYTATISGGAQYDSNRNSGSRNAERLVLGTLAQSVGDSKKDSDWSLLSVVDLQFSHEFEGEAGHKIRGGINYLNQDQFSRDELDLDAYTVTLGPELNYRWAKLMPSFYATALTLSNDNFLTLLGTRLATSRRLSEAIDLNGELSLEYQDYNGTKTSPTLIERTGFSWTAKGQASYAFNPKHRLGLDLRITDKHAKRSLWGYEGAELGLNHTWLLGRGQFLRGGASIGRDNYQAADARVDNRPRHDLRSRGRLMYGAPFPVLLGRENIGGVLGSAFATLTAEYLRVGSNLPNFRYDNWRFSLLVSKRWNL